MHLPPDSAVARAETMARASEVHAATVLAQLKRAEPSRPRRATPQEIRAFFAA